MQYAIYGDRGVWIAKKLRRLWKAGCDVAIIYSVSSRPVLSVLRSNAGRGPVPMKQSVVKDYWGNIVKYNHSKWMTISGRWGRSRGVYQTFSGSANWANLGLRRRRADAAILQPAPDPAPQRGLREDLAPGVVEAATRSARGGVRPGATVAPWTTAGTCPRSHRPSARACSAT